MTIEAMRAGFKRAATGDADAFAELASTFLKATELDVPYGEGLSVATAFYFCAAEADTAKHGRRLASCLLLQSIRADDDQERSNYLSAEALAWLSRAADAGDDVAAATVSSFASHPTSGEIVAMARKLEKDL